VAVTDYRAENIYKHHIPVDHNLLWFLGIILGLSKGVGFIRFDQRMEAERAISELNGSIPNNSTDPITVKFANNPSNSNKAIPPLAAYLAPQAARRFAGPIHHATGRFRCAIAII